jgi:hypothetical protein
MPWVPSPFIRPSGIKCWIEIWIGDMEFVRVDANDRPVLLMQISDLEHELSSVIEIIIKLVP